MGYYRMYSITALCLFSVLACQVTLVRSSDQDFEMDASSKDVSITDDSVAPESSNYDASATQSPGEDQDGINNFKDIDAAWMKLVKFALEDSRNNTNRIIEYLEAEKLTTSRLELILASNSTSGAEFDSLFVCENKSLSLNCTSGKVMTILYAHFGRSNSSSLNQLCPGPGPTAANPIDPIPCLFEETSLEIAAKRCNNRPSCQLYAVNWMFGDNCPNMQKYLEVHKVCSSPV